MTPKTNAQRQKGWRDKRKAEGYQTHLVWLEPDVAAKLDRMIGKAGKKHVERQRIINQAIRQFSG